ncbi:AAA family ATPase [Capnocytophaga canis]|uniref:AAA family ATPase n=1 Tax=Capnocytophaga canis TaxID=1848903 RepID=UPI0015626345|nr:AAA family ATPase [Capnocytophaga canis]
MRLHSLKIKGFRRLKDVEVLFGDTTFLIGQNNCGKSSIIKAIEALLSSDKRLSQEDYYSILDNETGEVKTEENIVVLEAEFRNVSEEANNWRGFKGRIFNYDNTEGDETGLSITYRKTYELGKDVIIEMKTKKRTKKEIFFECKKPQDYIDNGIDSNLIEELFPNALNKNITSTNQSKLEDIDDIWDISEEEEWFKNPGGIPGNVLKMLPRFLLIPVGIGSENIQGSKGVLSDTLNELFQTVRENSENFRQAQHYLNELSKELDPTDNDSEFGKMMTDLNGVLSSVFPDSKLHATTSLSEPTNLKPSFNVQMSSNVRTSIENQGTGMIRSAVFGMLRYRQKFLSRNDDNPRSLLICFEEPEVYLHPSAANQMRNTIYELSSSSSQIIATTHSPYLIDISRRPRQILNRLKNDDNFINCDTFSVSEKFRELQENDKDYIKMLLKIDDYISRVFFTKKVIIIEGDTEEIVIKESLRRLDREQYFRIVSDFEIIKSRGKATIISLVKYLVSMGIEPIVVHDKDSNTPNAERFNEPILQALNGRGRRIFMENNIEEELEYSAPSSDKPYNAYRKTQEWGATWENLPERWKNKMKEIFGNLYIS